MDHSAHEHHQHHEHDAQDHAGHGHTGHEDHASHGAQAKTASWGMAASATLHCLTGCAIGEVLGVVIGTALGWHGAATIALAIALAFLFGYALTMRGVLRAGLSFKEAFKVALAADTISIAVMEIVDNAFILAIPGAMEMGLADPRFWLTLAAALAIAFVVTVPINRWLISRGKGHAVVHQHHH
ncbi:DUF4396 domain-containing protein [Glycomyces luteolus]|uniref:DUF4396 domain-containing protein n=1 Tax=Glycomyces luteolus TaxID=2670330 RepID=A0A9X3SSV3_9ACTN|nr:DUF4396 domain-containing protein [Glycomyces luteolus]MDA1359578.1 DUF4396 domain-containing protein [Glycomyces luteolus]